MPTTTQHSDADLVLASRRGDRSAFSEIVRRYQALISGLAYSSCGNLPLSEDIAQETFLSAWKSLSGLRDPAKLPAWLCQIARHRLLDHHRAARPEARLSNVVGHEQIDNHPSPADLAITDEQRQLLWQNLEQIPQPYRETMVMYYRQQSSAADVAAALEITEDTVRQRLVRGRQLLREQIAQMLERDLERTAPKPQFTAAVIAALPGVVAQSTASVTLAKASGATKAASLLTTLGVFTGPALAVLLGITSIRDSIRSGQTPREKRVIIQNTLVVGSVILFCVAAFGACMIFGDFRGIQVINAQTIFWATFTPLVIPLIIWASRRHLAIRRTEGLDDRLPAPSRLTFFLGASCAILGSQVTFISMALYAGDQTAASVVTALVIVAEVVSFLVSRRVENRTYRPIMIVHMLVLAAVCFIEANFRLPMWSAKLNHLTIEQAMAQFPRLQINLFLAAVFGFGLLMAIVQLAMNRKRKSSIV